MLTITLNRPEVLNAIDLAMHEQLSAAFDEAADPALRAIVVTGAGRGFCVGQDVGEFPADPAEVGELLTPPLQPTRACHPGAREARHRSRQRCCCRSRVGARPGL